jgi:hypothetical protein
MLDSTQLAALLQTRALAPFRLTPQATRQMLQALVEQAIEGSLMPGTQHSGLTQPCRLIELGPADLWLQAPNAHPTANASPALAVFALGHHLLRLELIGLRETTGREDATLRCEALPAAWQLPRRELFRIAPPEKPSMSLLAPAPGGVGTWRGELLDLGIGGLAFDLQSDRRPCKVDEILPACQLSGGNYHSPHFHLRVRSVQARKSDGHWRVGAALLDPPREVVSSLQLATYRFEVAQRLDRIERLDNQATKPQRNADISARRRQADRP